MIPFSPPKIDQKVLDEVVDSLRSGWITTGPKTKALEKKLSEYTSVTDVLCVNSCTSGLFLMLKWYGVKEGDEVIVPAYTYSASANVILHCGARPIMVDINEDFTLDINDVKEKLSNKTKAIISVDLGGLPCDYDELIDILNSTKTTKSFKADSENQKKLNRPLLLADAAHSIGATYKGVRVGSIADATVFSFHAVKNLTTAEGGAICFNLPEPFSNNKIYDDLRIKSLHGQTKDALTKSKIGGWEYDIIEPGYKFNMPDVLAAIGLVEIDRYSETLLKRKEIFEIYTEKLSSQKWAIIPEYINEIKTSSFHLYLLRIKGFNEEKRNQLINRMSKKGIATNVHYKPLPLLSLYKGLGYKMKSYPMAYSYYEQEISLPVYYDLSKQDSLEVVETLIEEVTSINA